MGYNLAEAGCKEALGNGATNCHGVALSQRTRCVLDTALGVEFGVARGDAAPLTQLLEFVKCVFACKGKNRVEHGRHVARIEEEAVAGNPCGVVGIGYEEIGVKDVDKVGTAHGTTGVTRFGFLDHRCYEHANVVGCPVK